VEPDQGFAEYLGRTMPQVQVVAVPFEEADVGDGFDAVSTPPLDVEICAGAPGWSMLPRN
jgi:hypothetical protein